MSQTPPTLPASELRAIAVAAECDPRTVRRRLLGAPVAHLSRRRIDRALRELGHADLLELLDGAKEAS